MSSSLKRSKSKSDLDEKPKTFSSSSKGEILNIFEHAYKRPDTYIGSITTTEDEMYVANISLESEDEPDKSDDEEESENEDGIEDGENDEKKKTKTEEPPKIIRRKIKYNPGMLRCVVEIISNAIDNNWRSKEVGTPQKFIKIEINSDPDSEKCGWITITNDGDPIPIEITKYKINDFSTGTKIVKKLYPAEAHFGEMLSGTNFNNDDKSKTSGRNGIGSKATNVFSKKVEIEHSDTNSGKLFKQSFSDNARKRTPPKVTSYSKKNNYTKFSFLLDFERFEYSGIDTDFIALIKRHAYEAAMVTQLPVFFVLNGVSEKISVPDLKAYARLFYSGGKISKTNFIHITSPTGDECVVCDLTAGSSADKVLMFEDSKDAKSMSFINGVYTKNGGLHVQAFQNAINKKFVKIFNEKNKTKLKANHLNAHILLFIRAEAIRPSFDEQSKHKFIGLEKQSDDTQPRKYTIKSGNKKIDDEFSELCKREVTKMLKWPFVAILKEKLKLESGMALENQKNEGFPKVGRNYRDADLAGTSRASETTLLVVEGLSAKNLAESWVATQEDGSKRFGVLALKGKVINVKKNSADKILENEEIKLIKQMLSLNYGMDYKNQTSSRRFKTKSSDDKKKNKFIPLRYGKVEIMTDADDDGIHITGLLITFFSQWPSLFEIEFVQAFSTAVVKVHSKSETKLFYSNAEFKKFVDSVEGGGKRIGKVKYLKGLGSHSKQDIADYDNREIITYVADDEAFSSIDLGFGAENKDKTIGPRRKKMILRAMKKGNGGSLPSSGDIDITYFVKGMYVYYCTTSVSRSIPDVMDGFNESKRKIFFGMRQKRYEGPSKGCTSTDVVSGSVKAASHYRHGQVSLEGAIATMAQGFVGSNNIPLLVRDAEFGDREDGGKHPSAARYTSTKLENIASLIFRKEDEPVLDYNYDGDDRIEPKRYAPVIPFLLVNGKVGQATGFSTEIPGYNPEALVKWVKAWIADEEERPELVPWYRGFKGESYMEKGKNDEPVWVTKGVMEKKGAQYVITELPIGLWPAKMNEHLEKLTQKGMKKNGGVKCLKKVGMNHTPNTVEYTLTPHPTFIPDMDTKGNLSILVKKKKLTNMVALNETFVPKRYLDPSQIIETFCVYRLETYNKRKEYQLMVLAEEYKRQKNRYMFVKAVVEGKLILYSKDKGQTHEEVEKELEDYGLERMPKKGKSLTSDNNENEEDEKEEKNPTNTYDYLLSLPMRSMTRPKINELKTLVDKLKTDREELEAKDIKDIWLQELDEFLEGWKKFIVQRALQDDIKKKKTKKKELKRSESLK